MNEIDAIIRAIFPVHLTEYDAFEDWCEGIRERVRPGAANLISELKRKLEDEERVCREKENAQVLGSAEALFQDVCVVSGAPIHPVC